VKKMYLYKFYLTLYEEMKRQLGMEVPLGYDLVENLAIPGKTREWEFTQHGAAMAIQIIGFASIDMQWSAQKTWEPKTIAQQLIRIGEMRLRFLKTDSPPGGHGAFWADAFNGFRMAYATAHTTGDDERALMNFTRLFLVNKWQSNYLQPKPAEDTAV